jgi:hypothetical protein
MVSPGNTAVSCQMTVYTKFRTPSCQQISKLIAAAAFTKATLAIPAVAGRMMADRVIMPSVLTSSVATSTASAGMTSVGLVSAGFVAPAVAPLLATVAAGAVLGYGVQKLTDWLFE